MADEAEDSKLPACGLYRTGKALKDREQQVAEGRLVYFHNHSRQGPPLVLLPKANEHNAWVFHERGYLVRDDDGFVEALQPLPAEGFYTLESVLGVTGGESLPERTLVQLGYDREARPILFVGRHEGNIIRFPEAGYRFDERVLRNLRPAGFEVLPSVKREDVH